PNGVCEVRNLSFPGILIEEGFPASLGMTANAFSAASQRNYSQRNTRHVAPARKGRATLSESYSMGRFAVRVISTASSLPLASKWKVTRAVTAMTKEYKNRIPRR